MPMASVKYYANTGGFQVSEHSGSKRRLEHSIPPKHLQGIGNVVVSFSLLEMQLRMLCASLIADSFNTSSIITSEMSFSALTQLARSLFLAKRGKNDPDYKKFQSIIGQADKCSDQRNRIVHDMWAIPVGQDKTVRKIRTWQKGNHGLQANIEDLTIGELDAHANTMKKLAFKVYALWGKYVDWDTHFERDDESSEF